MFHLSQDYSEMSEFNPTELSDMEFYKQLFDGYDKHFKYKFKQSLNLYQELGAFALNEPIIKNSVFHNGIYERNENLNRVKFYFSGYMLKDENDSKILNGLFVFINGQIFEGMIKFDDHSGYGRLIYNQEEYYIGQIKRNKRHGQERLFKKNNEVKEGTFDFNDYQE